MFYVNCLLKEKSSLKTSIKSICGEVCHWIAGCQNSTRKVKEQLILQFKQSKVCVDSVCAVLENIGKMNDFKIGFYYKSSNTFLNVVSK